MVSVKTIAEAIQHVDEKKENLKKAFDDLQSRSSLLSSFALSWSDIDSHFKSIQNSIAERFDLLQSRDAAASISELEAIAPSNLPSTSKALANECRDDSAPDSSTQPAVPRQELSEFCEKMDGKGLMKFVTERREEREAIRVELPGAFKSSPDPGALVLDAIEESYVENSGPKSDMDPEFGGVRRICVLLLEQLMEIGASFSDEVRERAKKLAWEWKGKVRLSGENSLATLGFLHLVAAYGLGTEFDIDELVDYLLMVAKYRQGIPLTRAIPLGDKLHGLVQKLLDGGKQLLSIRYICEFGLTDKFPLVPILNAYLDEIKNDAKKISKDGKNTLRSQNSAASKEVAAMNQVIKVIKDHKLETVFSPGTIQNNIAKLEKQIENRKRLLSAPAAKPPQQGKRKGKKQQSDNKRPRNTAPLSRGAASLSIAGSSRQQSHLQPAGLLPAGHYALAGATSTISPYVGSSAGLYGLAGASLGVQGNSNPALSHLYASSESQNPASYRDRLTAFGGYGLPPQYHQSYFPQ